MSTRDIAISIIDKLSEKQLEGFINMFSDFVDTESGEDEAYASYLSLKEMIKEIPDLDYDKELAKHREEKYGN